MRRLTSAPIALLQRRSLVLPLAGQAHDFAVERLPSREYHPDALRRSRASYLPLPNTRFRPQSRRAQGFREDVLTHWHGFAGQCRLVSLKVGAAISTPSAGRAPPSVNDSESPGTSSTEGSPHCCHRAEHAIRRQTSSQPLGRCLGPTVQIGVHAGDRHSANARTRPQHNPQARRTEVQSQPGTRSLDHAPCRARSRASLRWRSPRMSL